MPKYTNEEINDKIYELDQLLPSLRKSRESEMKYGQNIRDLLDMIHDNGGKTGLKFWLKLYVFIFNKLTIAIGTFILLGLAATLYKG